MHKYVIFTESSLDVHEVTGLFVGVQDGNLLFMDPKDVETVTTKTEHGDKTEVRYNGDAQAFPMTDIQEVQMYPA